MACRRVAHRGRVAAVLAASYIGVQPVKVELGSFADGEVAVKVVDDIGDSDVFVVQSTTAPVNDHLMELLLLVRCPIADAMWCLTAQLCNRAVSGCERATPRWMPHGVVCSLCCACSTLRRSSARSIIAVMPYYGYKRDIGSMSPSNGDEEVVLSAADVARMLEAMVGRVHGSCARLWSAGAEYDLVARCWSGS